MKMTALRLAFAVLLLMVTVDSVRLRASLASANRELAGLEQEKLEISLLVGNLGECYEAGELGPDQGCRQQIEPVVALGEKALPCLMQTVSRNDWHMVLNAARCIRALKPALTPRQIDQLKRRQEVIQSLIPKDCPAPAASLTYKMQFFAALELGAAISASVNHPIP